MVYQDHLTKFCVLRPLTSKRAAGVAFQLLDIFLLLGAPCVLQSDNGSEFTAHVITELKVLWPELVMVHGKPRHPQSQGSVERAKCDIKDMLVCWLGDNNTTEWTVGLKFVQFQKNSSLHSGIKCSPFAALLGSGARTGLSSSSLPPEILHRLQSEDDLLAAIPMPVPGEDVDHVTTATDSSVSDPATLPNSQTTSDEVTMNAQVELVSSRQQAIQIQRKRANEAQTMQAERMVKRSKRIFAPVQVGDNVTISIPHVDRGRTDPRNIIGVVTECSDNDIDSIAVKGGTLSGKYPRNQIGVCATKLYSADDFNTENTVSLRQAVQLESKCGGQGFTKCNCADSKHCQTNRCRCFKAKMQCNSRCHSTLPCTDKLS
ncbi:uncharacterized protein LOC121367580 [Gigantopelta aegis]|uniref:uncharacterized protein LOC121367580 n=1 Tax=Gigantopelta aegis TaxID=1735272 RepID=UPI001B889650|nr:uncharacterized protein LOC121367580 [Gigantopelta aegis]